MASLHSASLLFIVLAGSGAIADEAANAPVNDRAFNDEIRSIGQELRIQQSAEGVYGRAGGSVASEEGAPGGAVSDRDVDRYVRQLGYELRLRERRAEQSPSGF